MVEHNGRSPTARQIAAALGGYSLGGVARALARLEQQGRIRRGRYGEARGIEIVGARFVLPEGAGPLP
jgi:SOS-response transcriptional repressor LexA